MTYSDVDAFSEEGSAFRCISLSFHCVLSELLRLQAPRPQVEEELPAVMRAEEQLTRLDREVLHMLVDDTKQSHGSLYVYNVLERLDDWMGFGSLKTDG